MLPVTFPLQLPPVRHEATYAVPTIESASPSSCMARARYTPKDITYETTVRLDDGEWTVETTTSGRTVWYENYPVARGHQIALAVINWWFETYHIPAFAPLPQEIATPRATWISRSAHKLLTEVPNAAEQRAALQMLASKYGLPFVPSNAAPTLKSANWATAADHHLERAIPEEERRRTVALLIEVILGWKEGGSAVTATEAAA